MNPAGTRHLPAGFSYVSFLCAVDMSYSGSGIFNLAKNHTQSFAYYINHKPIQL